MKLLYIEISDIAGITKVLKQKNLDVHRTRLRSRGSLFDGIDKALEQVTESDVMIVSETAEAKFRLAPTVVSKVRLKGFTKPVLVLTGPIGFNEKRSIEYSGNNVTVFTLSDRTEENFLKLRVALAQRLDSIGPQYAVPMVPGNGETNSFHVGTDGREKVKGYWVEPNTNDIYYGNTRVNLLPRYKRVMAIFIAAIGEVVTSDQLHNALGKKVGMGTIYIYVSQLRTELTKHAKRANDAFRTSELEIVSHDSWRLTANTALVAGQEAAPFLPQQSSGTVVSLDAFRRLHNHRPTGT